MTIDPRDIKPGDSVKLRCGGTALVKMTDETTSTVFLWFTKRQNLAYNFDGLQRRDGTAEDSPFDIVEIIPASLTAEERLARIAGRAQTYIDIPGCNPLLMAMDILKLARGE